MRLNGPQISYMPDRIYITFNTATIKTTSIERDHLNCVFRSLYVDGICELDLTISACRLITQNIKNIRSQDIATNASKVRRRFVSIGLFNKTRNDSGSPFLTTTPYLDISGPLTSITLLGFACGVKCPHKTSYDTCTLIDEKVIC